MVRVDDAAGRYIEFCKSTVPEGFSLRGLRIAVDCAHGATYHIAPSVLSELGAEVITMGVQPDGFNINEGVGSTDMAALSALVRQQGADIGIAYDGDGDRVLMTDEKGEIIDGDELVYIIAMHRLATGTQRRRRGGYANVESGTWSWPCGRRACSLFGRRWVTVMSRR